MIEKDLKTLSYDSHVSHQSNFVHASGFYFHTSECLISRECLKAVPQFTHSHFALDLVTDLQE